MRAGISTSKIKNPFSWGKQFLAKKVANSINSQNIIAVTGSHQVDLTSIYISSILASKFKTIVSLDDKDPLKRLLDSLAKFRSNINRLVVGVYILKDGDTYKYLKLVKPGSLVIPMLVDQKGELLVDLNSEVSNLLNQIPISGWTVLNFDNEVVKKLSDKSSSQVFSFGTDQKSCLIWADNIRLENFSTVFGINYGVERVEVKLQAIGKHFIYPALAAASMGIINGFSLISIKKALESVGYQPNNLELREGLKGWWVLDDCFDNDPISFSWALKVLSDFGAKRKILILGDLKGFYTNRYNIAEEIFFIKPDLILLSGQNTNSLASELIKLGITAERIYQDQTNSEIVAKVLTYASRGDLVLIKGAKSLRLDEVIERISKPLKL